MPLLFKVKIVKPFKFKESKDFWPRHVGEPAELPFDADRWNKIKRRRKLLKRQAKLLLPWWSRLLGQRLTQIIYNVLELKGL